jgi:ADP-ribose pyrophosphatase YjhB (NUDIX family)
LFDYGNTLAKTSCLSSSKLKKGVIKMAKGMVSAVCINWPKKEILLIWNTADPEKPLGFWGLPGGKMKEEESPETGAIRELYQETNQEGTVLKFAVEIPKTGPYGDYIHSFIAIKIISERELKNYEDPQAIPRWIPLEEIISGRVKLFRGHIRGLMLVLEKMAEEKKTAAKGRVNKHGFKILSEGPSPALELLNELRNAFSENGQFIPFYRHRPDFF